MKVKWYGLVKNQPILSHVPPVHSAIVKGIQWIKEEKDLKKALEQTERAVVLLYSNEEYDIYELCRKYTTDYPHILVILLDTESKIDLKKAMRVGAMDAIRLPGTTEEWEQALQTAQHRIRMTNETKDGLGVKADFPRIITVCGTKGGIGKTTVTVNLAVTLTKYDLKVAVVDADLQFGDTAIIMDLQPKRSIYELVKDDNLKEIKRYLTSHKSGVDLLCAPFRPEQAEEIQGQHIEAILDELRLSYDIILIDTPPAFVDTSLVAMENSTDILMITSMELPTLKNTRLGMETLETLGLKDKTKMILNRDSEVEGLKVEAVEEILGASLYVRIPSEGNIVVPSINQGIPFVISHSRAAVSRSIFSLASRLLGKRSPSTLPKKEPISLLSKMLRRG